MTPLVLILVVALIWDRPWGIIPVVGHYLFIFTVLILIYKLLKVIQKDEVKK